MSAGCRYDYCRWYAWYPDTAIDNADCYGTGSRNSGNRSFPGGDYPGCTTCHFVHDVCVRPLLDQSKSWPDLPPDEQPETSPYYLLEVIAVMASLVVFFYLITAGATGNLSFIPLGGLLVPIAWLGFMFPRLQMGAENKTGRFLLL